MSDFRLCQIRSVSRFLAKTTQRRRRLLTLSGGIVFLLGSCEPQKPHPQADRVPERPTVVSLVPSVTDLLVALNGVELLVARTDFDTAAMLGHLPSVGGGLDPSLERMAMIAPDVVLMPRTRDQPVLGARLEELGIDVRVLPIESLDDLRMSIDSVGIWFDLISPADSLLELINETFAAVAEAVRGLPSIAVVYVVWSDPPMVAGSGTFIAELLEMVGAENVFADLDQHWPSVSLEAVIASNPDFLVWPRSVSSDRTIEDIRALPGWREIPAVKDGRVVFVDSELFGRPGPRIAEAAIALLGELRPQIPQDQLP